MGCKRKIKQHYQHTPQSVDFPSRSKKGFTFIEVMVTLAILSAGIVGIYRSFFVCLDYINHLTHRLHAISLIENRFAHIERNFQIYHSFNFNIGSDKEFILINNKEIEFTFDTEIVAVDQMTSLYQVDLDLVWEERGREIRVSKSAYLSDINFVSL